MRILKYITRTWDEVDTPAHPRMEMLPSIVWDLFGVIIVLGVICILNIYIFK